MFPNTSPKSISPVIHMMQAFPNALMSCRPGGASVDGGRDQTHVLRRSTDLARQPVSPGRWEPYGSRDRHQDRRVILWIRLLASDGGHTPDFLPETDRAHPR